MERTVAAKLLSEQLKNLFAFSLSRLYDRSEAEDLTNDIVCEVLKGASRLQNDDAFYAFMWKIAENTFKKHIRKNSLRTVEFDEGFVGAYWVTPEDEYMKTEELRLLRRELSLLSKQYRETTTAYYMEGKSCSEIAADLGIRVEMVKYYLFKTRKILKEGVGLVREFGEKSYNPGMFRIDYWGDGDNSCYRQLFKRKLPGNILLSAYAAPVTIQDLSMELGVAVAYLEDEMDLLVQQDLIRKIGHKYQTNILIFTEDYEQEWGRKAASVCEKASERLDQRLSECLPVLSTMDFKGNTYTANRLKWTFANVTMMFALQLSDEQTRERFGEYPLLSNGSHGFVFGYDNNYVHHHFRGIYDHCENSDRTAYFSVTNYRVIEKCQAWEPVHWHSSVEAMCGAILEKEADPNNEMLIRLMDEGFISCHNGKLSAEFPVFSANQLNGAIWQILQPAVREVTAYMTEACELAAQMLKHTVPQALLDRCDSLAFIRHRMDVMALVIEKMVEQGQLIVPEENEKLCVFGVKQ